MVHGLVVERHSNLWDVVPRDVIVLCAAFHDLGLIYWRLQSFILHYLRQLLELIILNPSIFNILMISLSRRSSTPLIFDLWDKMNDFFLHYQAHVLHVTCRHYALLAIGIACLPVRVLWPRKSVSDAFSSFRWSVSLYILGLLPQIFLKLQCVLEILYLLLHISILVLVLL